MGIRPKINKIGETKKYECGRCHNVEKWDVYEKRTWFSLFFLPVIPLHTTYFEQCPICHGFNELSKDDAMHYKY